MCDIFNYFFFKKKYQKSIKHDPYTFSKTQFCVFYSFPLISFTVKLIICEQMNIKSVCKSRKTFGNVHINCRTLFSTKRNKFTERYDKYNY